jgi:hypothetical protein
VSTKNSNQPCVTISHEPCKSSEIPEAEKKNCFSCNRKYRKSIFLEFSLSGVGGWGWMTVTVVPTWGGKMNILNGKVWFSPPYK